MGVNEDLLRRVAKLLKEKRLKIATAESCTGGMLG
ncbi:MAG: CinA family protein, partial [Thermoplasmata archaeon]